MVTYPSTHGVFETEIARGVRRGARRRRPGVRRRRQPQRAGRAGPARPLRRRRVATSTCTRRSASRTAAAAPGSGRWRSARTWRRTCRTTRCSRWPVRRPVAGPVCAAPWGSASILPISWAYVRLMGPDGLAHGDPGRRSSPPTTSPPGCAPHYPVLYTGRGGLVAHECIVDLRPITKADRRHRRRRGQAADRLRLPRADDVVPGGRHADDRADRERGPRRAGPVRATR